MRTAIGAVCVVSPSRPYSVACMIPDAFLSQQRQTTNLRIQGSRIGRRGIHITNRPSGRTMGSDSLIALKYSNVG